MMEAGVVIDCLGNAVHWHLPPGRSGGALPDSQDLWEVLYKLNNEQAYGGSRLLGFAHSHPGNGDCGPSLTDLTTFDAIERGLGRGGVAGRQLLWWIVNADSVSLTESEGWRNAGGEIERKWLTTTMVSTSASWIHKLRVVSGLVTLRRCYAGRNHLGRLDGSSTCDLKPEPYSAFCATHIRDEALVRAYFAP